MYSETLSRRDRARVLSEQQGHRCCYCGVRFSDQMPDDLRLYYDPRPSVEHVRRLADGGKQIWWNEVAACRGCNSARGEMDPEEFYRIVSRGDIDELRRALRTSMSAKRRSRETLRRHASPHHSAQRIGPKWPPAIEELPITPGRQEYFALIGAVHREPVTNVPLPDPGVSGNKRAHKRGKKKMLAFQKAIVEINGIRALRWNVRSV